MVTQNAIELKEEGVTGPVGKAGLGEGRTERKKVPGRVEPPSEAQVESGGGYKYERRGAF